MLTIQSHDQIVQLKEIMQEDEERFDHFLGLLEKWMDCHAFLPKDYDKRMLPIFLRNCKYNLDKTKHKLEMYFVYKKRYPETFGFYEFNDAEEQGLKNFYLFEASKLTPEGYRVAFGGFRSSVSLECDMNVVNKILAMYGTYRSNMDVINCGVIMIIDFKNLSPSIVSGVWNTFFIRLLGMLQKVYPFRVAGIYVNFLPSFAIPFANMLKIIFSQKIKNRIFLDSENKEVKKNIPMYCLPEEFGGTDGTINENTEKFMQVIMQNKPWFIEDKKIQIVGNISNDLYDDGGVGENFGIQGSFRKINLD